MTKQTYIFIWTLLRGKNKGSIFYVELPQPE